MMTIYSFFTDFMSDIFGDSQRQFHNTFSQTYGHLYERSFEINLALGKLRFYQFWHTISVSFRLP